MSIATSVKGIIVSLKSLLTKVKIALSIASFLLIYSGRVGADVLKPRVFSSAEHEELAEIVLNAFYEELYLNTKGLTLLVNEKKLHKGSLNSGRRGKMIIEKMKQRNREKMALMRGFDPEKIKSGKDLVKLQQKDNKILLERVKEKEKELNRKNLLIPLQERRSSLWQKQAKQEMENLRKRVLLDHREWRKKHRKKLKSWYEKKLKFNNKIDDYRKTLIDIPLVLPVSKEDLIKKIKEPIEKDFYVVASAFTPDIRDQQYRSTCSSFSGIRAIEILLSQNQDISNLSEQYFYWASKRQCQKQSCKKKGSWVGNGLKYSQELGDLNIPLEESCPYNSFEIKNNETQIPLHKNCSQGYVKIRDFSYLSKLDDVVVSLKLNKPVIVSIKLSPNFYNNKGLVLDKGSSMKGKRDSHASGHSILLIGYLKLPRVLSEGRVCFIAANSWGKGWGHGGYSCISEKWLLKYRKRNPFVVVNSIKK